MIEEWVWIWVWVWVWAGVWAQSFMTNFHQKNTYKNNDTKRILREEGGKIKNQMIKQNCLLKIVVSILSFTTYSYC